MGYGTGWLQLDPRSNIAVDHAASDSVKAPQGVEYAPLPGTKPGARSAAVDYRARAPSGRREPYRSFTRQRWKTAGTCVEAVGFGRPSHTSSLFGQFLRYSLTIRPGGDVAM